MRCRSSLAHTRWLAAFLPVALSALFLPITASAADTTTVSILAPSEPLEAGEQFSVSVEVAPNTAIAGMQFDLHFDPSLVAVESVIEGNLLGQAGAGTFFNSGNIDNEAGTVRGAFGAITSPGETVSTQGTFATILLTAKQESGSCPLSLLNVIVGDKEGKAVPVTFDNPGPPSGAEGRSVFSLWVLSVIIGVAVVVIAATIIGIMVRRRQMLRALEEHRPHS
jgi:hypothetical protein